MRRKAIAAWSIRAARIRGTAAGAKRRMASGKAFGMPDHQQPTGHEDRGELFEQTFLGGAIEVDHDIAAEDRIETLVCGPLRL